MTEQELQYIHEVNSYRNYMNGVNVIISKKCTYPTPNGHSYLAKGAYRQGKFIIVVGRLGKQANTIRLKYPADDVQIEMY